MESDLSKMDELIRPHGGTKVSPSIPKDDYQFSESFIRQFHEGVENALVYLCDTFRVRGRCGTATAKLNL